MSLRVVSKSIVQDVKINHSVFTPVFAVIALFAAA